MPSYPGERFPRVVGVVRPADGVLETSAQLKHLWGDATKPRGDGYRLIAHVVNDRSPTWGAGFARAVRNKWGAVQDEFRSWIAADSERLRLGVTHQAPVTADIGIVHMIAQHGYGESSGAAHQIQRSQAMPHATSQHSLGTQRIRSHASYWHRSSRRQLEHYSRADRGHAHRPGCRSHGLPTSDSRPSRGTSGRLILFSDLGLRPRCRSNGF